MGSRTRTRTVNTIGSIDTFDAKMIGAMLEQGTDTIRINASHSDHPAQILTVAHRIEFAQSLRSRISGTLLDLQGPKIRIAKLTQDIPVSVGQMLFLHPETETPTTCPANATPVPVPNALLNELIHESKPNTIRPGQRVLFADGKFRSTIIQCDAIQKTALLRIDYIAYGETHLKSRKGINFPDTRMPFPSLSEKDRADAEAGLLSRAVHYVALSFVRNAEDVRDFRALLEGRLEFFAKLKAAKLSEVANDPLLHSETLRLHQLVFASPRNPESFETRWAQLRVFLSEADLFLPKIIAKIELPEAITNLDAITRESDGLMIARGDLSVEAGVDNLFSLQLQISRAAKNLNRPFIVATNVLDGLEKEGDISASNGSDVGLAILTGADAIMTSNETATPRSGTAADAVARLVRLIQNAEASIRSHSAPLHLIPSESGDRILDRRIDEFLATAGGRPLICQSEDADIVWEMRRHGALGRIVFSSNEANALRQTSLLQDVRIENILSEDRRLDRSQNDCLAGRLPSKKLFVCCAGGS